MKTTNTAIIGSNGFIGKHLTFQLLENKGCNLFLFGRSNKPEHFKDLNYTQIDLLDKHTNAHLFKEMDLVYYLASETIPANSWDDPMTDVEKNLVPFLTFAESLTKTNVKKIVYLSSAGTVYGTTFSKVDENADKNPFSPYGIIKLAIENFLLYYKTKHQINYDIFRISNVYGPGQDTSKGLGLINTFLEKITEEKRIRIFGNGENLRNYIYVKDAVKLLSLSQSGNINTSNTFNLSSDDTLTINEIVALLKEIIHEPFEVNYEGQRQSDNAAINLDNSKLKRSFPGFRFTPIRTGIEETYSAIVKQSSTSLKK